MDHGGEAFASPKAAARGPQGSPDGFRHGVARPKGGGARRPGAGGLQNSGDDVPRERRATRLAGFGAQEAIDTFFGVTLPPSPPRRMQIVWAMNRGPHTASEL